MINKNKIQKNDFFSNNYSKNKKKICQANSLKLFVMSLLLNERDLNVYKVKIEDVFKNKKTIKPKKKTKKYMLREVYIS